MTAKPLSVVQACLDAYVAKDRTAIERLISETYHFTSPLDNAIDRKTYFDRCWPNSRMMTRFDIISGAEEGERAYVIYEGHTSSGKMVRNCEVHTVRNGQLVTTEVYFGWDLPHPAPKGGFTQKDGQKHGEPS
jgi:hypothetical protein